MDAPPFQAHRPDAQWDLLLGLLGGAAGFFVLGPLHDRSMPRLQR